MTVNASRKYNPGFLSDDELVASFCIRTSEFESMVEMLRSCIGDSNPHQIVIGPRGSGKTCLLLRVAAEVRRDTDLAHGFFPIVFAEESYEVRTAGEFWLECLARLADQAPHRADAPDLHRTFEDLRVVHDDETLSDRCLAALLDFADQEGKRLVLLVENLNMMFGDITDRDVGWRLRKVLQTEPRIVLLASANSRFDEIDKPDHALYDLFRTLTLRPLDTKECAALWESVSGQSRPRETIRSLEILTGGSPRLLAIVARFGAALSFRELLDSLLDLVDDHTEYFKSHLESLPPQERRVYLALADLWKPALTKEIAARARLTTSMCSAQLARLIERGVVLVAGGSARRKLYYLSERLYNIYYLLRRNRGTNRLIEALVQFMAFYYSPPELRDIGARMAREAQYLAPETRPFYQLAYARLITLPDLAKHNMERKHAACSTDDVHEQATSARVLFERGVALSKQDRMEEAREVFDRLVRRFGESEIPALREGVSKALTNKGVALGALGRPKEELAAYEEVLHRCGEADAPALLEVIAKALINKGVTLRTLDRPEEALAAYEEVLRRFRGSDTPTILKHVATALVNKSATLAALCRVEEALAACDECIDCFGESDAPEISEQMAKALFNKGVALAALGRPVEALGACEEVVYRFGESDVPVFREQVAMALLNKCVALVTLDRLEDAVAACDDVLRRFGKSDVPGLLEQVVKALINKGIVLTALGRSEEALTACKDVLQRLDGDDAPALLGLVATGLVDTLMRISADVGPMRLRDTIHASPAADLLLPLSTALDQEMGLSPQVAREVEEVADDIRKRLATLKHRSDSTSHNSMLI